jgi:hypothetical protein
MSMSKLISERVFGAIHFTARARVLDSPPGVARAEVRVQGDESVVYLKEGEGWMRFDPQEARKLAQALSDAADIAEHVPKRAGGAQL